MKKGNHRSPDVTQDVFETAVALCQVWSVSKVAKHTGYSVGSVSAWKKSGTWTKYLEYKKQLVEKNKPEVAPVKVKTTVLLSPEKVKEQSDKQMAQVIVNELVSIGKKLDRLAELWEPKEKVKKNPFSLFN